MSGEVIGISTMKLVKKSVNGIGFALSAGDLLAVLRRFYPSVTATNAAVKSGTGAPGKAPGMTETDSAAPQEAPHAPVDVAPAPAAKPVPFAKVAPGTGTVSVSSDPDGAEIYIDGTFFGNAPATLKLPSGAHEFVLKARGRVDWKRTLEVLKGSKTTLDAVLLRAR
jgi:hypothetical protein